MKDLIISAVIGGVIGVVGFWVVYYLFSGGHKKEWQISDEEPRICYIEKNSELDDLRRRTIDEYNKKLYAENKLDLLATVTDSSKIHDVLNEKWNEGYVYAGKLINITSGKRSTRVLDYAEVIGGKNAYPIFLVDELYVYRKEQPKLGLAVLE
ncbi:hypothetical protein OXT66_05745 [Lentilactobacillus senioris]|uniref:hypothetical protein n=1 Tax=Lentilactobacillus senioris TaxID=931534 RepID=UPI0022805EF3|nr:hypothetical protein [Lentilactobacillus senioris]MCY9807052.1 hypothetical protein [Lentilactobacillus senioris]